MAGKGVSIQALVAGLILAGCLGPAPQDSPVIGTGALEFTCADPCFAHIMSQPQKPINDVAVAVNPHDANHVIVTEVIGGCRTAQAAPSPCNVVDPLPQPAGFPVPQPTADSDFYSRAHVSWDGGHTFTPVAFEGDRAFTSPPDTNRVDLGEVGYGSMSPAIMDDGTVIILAYRSQPPEPHGTDPSVVVRVLRSEDGGATFAASTPMFEPSPAQAALANRESYAIRYLSLATRGPVALACWAIPTRLEPSLSDTAASPTTATVIRICAVSSDNARTWREPVEVSRNGGARATILVDTAIDLDGTLAVGAIDQLGDSFVATVYVSKDVGVTWAREELPAQDGIGELAMAATPNGLHVITTTEADGGRFLLQLWNREPDAGWSRTWSSEANGLSWASQVGLLPLPAGDLLSWVQRNDPTKPPLDATLMIVDQGVILASEVSQPGAIVGAMGLADADGDVLAAIITNTPESGDVVASRYSLTPA